MSQYQINQPCTIFTDSRRAAPDLDDTSSLSDYEETESIDTIRTALNTHDSVTYSESNMDKMNVNDMMFAWRSITNPTSISDYFPTQGSNA